MYHFSNFLKITLPPTHPFFSSLLLTSSKIPKLIKQTFVKYAWEECSDIVVFRGEYDTTGKDGELSSITAVGDTGTNTRDPLNDSASLEPQVTVASVPRRTPRISKATGIPTHVMLLADMQKVIEAQHHFLFKMKTAINEEFDKRQVGHATFQVQKQVEHMLSAFQDKIIKKVDELGTDKDGLKGSSSSTAKINPFGGTEHEGRWFYWDGAYRRVPEDWVFPNKMTLRSAWHRYHLVDHELGICPMKYLKTTDVVKQPNGRRNISNYKMLMKHMIQKCKEIDCYVDKPSENDVNEMYQKVSSQVLKLSNNKRCELFSWYTHVRNVNRELKRIRNEASN